RRVAVVPGVDALADAKLAAEDVRAAGGVDHPASGGDALLALLGHEDRVPVVSERHVLHAPAAERVGAGFPRPPEQLVLEPAPVDLMGERVEVTRGAELHPLG